MARGLGDSALAPQILAQLGFSETEALVYCELLRAPGVTGYRVALTLEKSQANVYSALASLAGKGAVLADQGEVVAYSAVPPSELLPRLEREYQARCAAAAEALADVGAPEGGDRIYQLRNTAQVYERAAAMCTRAADSVSFELFHIPFQRMAEPLAAAVARGVGVAGVTFDRDDRLAGATCQPAAKASRVSRWPGDQLTLVTDAKEALVALFDRRGETVLHAVYTDSTYLACLLHAATVDAVTLNAENPPVLQESANKRLFGRIPAGFLQLIDEHERRR
ncbi:MAG: TrmB family transcriptional regulator [Alphaproteobacteria bacterium]|nr:MAG: TrmB family transcriptional regulator [Alphaproteobacteria bacterium]